MVKFNISSDNLRILLASTEFTAPAKDYVPALENVTVSVNASRTSDFKDYYRIDVLSTDRYMLFHTKVESDTGSYGLPIDMDVSDATFRLPPAFFDAVKTVLRDKPTFVTVVLETDSWEITSVASVYRGSVNNHPNSPEPSNLYRLFNDEVKELYPVAVSLSAQNLARINKAETLAKVSAPSATRSWTMGTTEPDRVGPGPVTLVSTWARILIMPISRPNDGLFLDYRKAE